MMFPSTENPTYREQFESFYELRRGVESIDEELNFIVSWMIGCRDCDAVRDEKGWEAMWEAGEKNYFTLLIFMPRKSQTTEFRVDFEGDFPHAAVENWLEEYIRPRIMRWYGWSEGEI